jgi:hypothetical protein
MEEITNRLGSSVLITEGQIKSIRMIFKDNTVQVLYKDTDIKEFSYVWISSFWNSRDMAYAISLYLDYHKIPHSHVERASSKITEHFFRPFRISLLLQHTASFVGALKEKKKKKN